MNTDGLTYKEVGVDIGRTDKMKQDMADILVTTDKRVMNRVGAFASLYDLSAFSEVENPVLVLKAEEPGSKQKLAFDYGYEKSICHDMINHLINDAIVMGAKPLTVLDVVITGNINEHLTTTLVEEMSNACKINFCSLVGGETSIQPGIVSDNICILSSSVVGIVDKNKIIDGCKINEGDAVLAIASNGLHTNGYTMIRKMMDIDKDIINKEIGSNCTFLQSIMKPHTAYYPVLKDIIDSNKVHGMAHITGGGIAGNLCRIIPDSFTANIDLSKVKTLPIFKCIRDFGHVSDEEMLSTFNCGVGLILVIDKQFKDEYISKINIHNECYEIGVIEKSVKNEKVAFNNQLIWD